jgi:hypothetical protein
VKVIQEIENGPEVDEYPEPLLDAPLSELSVVTAHVVSTEIFKTFGEENVDRFGHMPLAEFFGHERLFFEVNRESDPREVKRLFDVFMKKYFPPNGKKPQRSSAFLKRAKEQRVLEYMDLTDWFSLNRIEVNQEDLAALMFPFEEGRAGQFVREQTRKTRDIVTSRRFLLDIVDLDMT